MNSFKIGQHKIDLLDFTTQANTVLGIRGTGKTYTATYIAEQLLKNGIPWITIDPIGVWRYLKVPGKGQGFKVVVAGGDGQDLPLTPESAPEIVRSAMQKNIPLVLDLYDMNCATKASRRTIVERVIEVLLYENKKYGPRHLFLEEAAEFAPQQIGQDCARVYGMIESLLRMGGNCSIGCTMINQRSEQLNKAVLELSACFFLHGQTGKNSLTSARDWLSFLDRKNATEITDSLPSLRAGQCWFWMRGVTENPSLLQMPEKESLHPDRKNPKLHTLEKSKMNVDDFVANLSENLKTILEKKKDDDPAELRKRIRDLEKQVKDQKPELKEVSVLTVSDRKELRDLTTDLHNVVVEAKAVMNDASQRLERFEKMLSSPATGPRVAPRHEAVFYAPKMKAAPAEANGELTQGMKKVLSVLVQVKHPMKANQVAVLAGYSPTSGGYAQTLATLRRDGLISGNGGALRITQEGIDILGGEYETIPQDAEGRINYWSEKLSTGCGRILRALFRIHPGSLTSTELAEATEHSPTSGGYAQNLAQLRALCLIDKGQPIKLSENLFT
jgi:hypothetical protein